MNTRLNVFAMTSVALLLGLATTGSAIAQEHTPDFPAPEKGERVSCEKVEWHRDMLGENPWVSDACHEAIVVDGQTWARFEAEFQNYNRSDGTFTADFRNNNGRSIGSVNLKPGPDQRVSLDGNPTRFSNLRRGQILNFYAPEGTYGFTTRPGASENEIAKVVRSDEEQSRQMAQSESERNRNSDRNMDRNSDRNTNRNRQQETLPATAGPLPIIALGGMLSLLGGLGLTTRRRLKTPNA